MRSSMSFQAKRELLAQTGPRYRVAPLQQKRAILDEFVAATGYARTYAIRLLGQPSIPPSAPVTRPRARTYGPDVVEALTVAWAAVNDVCAKRLVPFLPELVASLERHGHLALSPEVRTQLLTLSPATADRLLRPLRERARPRGIGTTKAGTCSSTRSPSAPSPSGTMSVPASWRPTWWRTAARGRRAPTSRPLCSPMSPRGGLSACRSCATATTACSGPSTRYGASSRSRCAAWTPTMAASSSTSLCWLAMVSVRRINFTGRTDTIASQHNGSQDAYIRDIPDILRAEP